MADVVLVASGGGHLEQLHMLADRLPIPGDRRWITFDTPQSRSMLDGERVDYVPYVGPRDYGGLLKNACRASQVGNRRVTNAVVSTGSGLALAYLPWAAARGIPTFYIESATRVRGPSFSGRILQHTPRVNMMTQHPGWADDQWRFAGSVFDGYEAIENVDRGATSSGAIRKAVVSLGTIRPYGFRRLVERVYALLGPNVDVTWQTGSTDVGDLPIDARSEIPRRELTAAMDAADVLIAHAGTGIALTAFSQGMCPVLVPREAVHGEHVDDHQAQTAALLAKAELAVVRRVDDLTLADLKTAATRRVVRRTAIRDLALPAI